MNKFIYALSFRVDVVITESRGANVWTVTIVTVGLI